MTWRDVAVIEVVYTSICIAGVILGYLNARDAWRDYQAVAKVDPANGRLSIAAISVRIEGARMFIHALLAAIGVSALTVSDPPRIGEGPWDNVLFGFLGRWGLLAVAILVLYQSIANRRLRHTLKTHHP